MGGSKASKPPETGSTPEQKSEAKRGKAKGVQPASPAEPATLVVGPAWVGDMVMAQALFKRLKQLEPDTALDVLAPKFTLPLLRRMPEVRRALLADFSHGELALGRRLRLGGQLKGQYQRALILPRSFKSALIPWAAGIKARIGYRGEGRGPLLTEARTLEPQALPQTVQRFLALAEPAGTEPPAVVGTELEPRLHYDPAQRVRLLTALGLTLDRPVVALLPGAEYGPAKQWPAGHFRALAQGLAESGHAIWVLGSPKERPLGAEIAAGIEGVRNLCGATELADTIDLLSACQAAVSNDSGLMHIAAAVGIPVVAIYGSTSPNHTPPLSAAAQPIWLQLPCSPCFQRHCPLKHSRCLTEINPAQVWQTVQGLLPRSATEASDAPPEAGASGAEAAAAPS